MRTYVEVERLKKIIQESSWTKKGLADHHVDGLHYCEFGCAYCSSDAGMGVKMRKQSTAKAVKEATGRTFDSHTDKDVTVGYANFVEALEDELNRKRHKPGAGKTVVYSQLTDGFSPVLERTGTTRRILELLVEKTNFRIRVLTKNKAVGDPKWVEFFKRHSDRFIVGLSVGTLNSAFTQKMEWKTSSPEWRLKALHNLQDAGVPTFGMLCPVFPQVLLTDELERLVDRIRPERCEHVWVEAYNERENWQHVRACYTEGLPMWNWMTRVYVENDMAVWSRYATDLYVRTHKKAKAEGWVEKLRYLLYETEITAEDAQAFRGLEGVLLQATPDDDGRSKNPAFRSLIK